MSANVVGAVLDATGLAVSDTSLGTALVADFNSTNAAAVENIFLRQVWTINGTAGRCADGDMIDGGDRRDLLISGSGVDFVDGGLDADGMGGCPGNDMVQGEGGNDTFYGGTGADTIIGGQGRDSMNGGSGSDQVLFLAVTDPGQWRQSRHHR